MVKILTLTDSLSERAGGLSHATLNLAASSALQWSSADFLLLAQKDVSEIDLFCQTPSNLEILKAPCLRNSFFPWSRSLYRMIDELTPDLIHLRGIWRQPSVASLRWKKKFPHKPLIVQTAGMLEPWARSRNKLLKLAYYQLIEKELLDTCDLLHATSHQEVETLVSLGVDSSRIALVEEGVFMPPLESLRQDKSISLRKLLFLSRLHPVKGLEMLLESWAMLRPRGWCCEIAGMGDSQYLADLKRMVSSLHLENSVKFLGPLSGEKKERILAESHAFVLPSLSESFGIAIAEAMSWGLPVITTTATPWDVIETKKLGWYVKPNKNSLSEALFDLFYSSQKELDDMGMRARDYTAQNFDWRVISSKMNNIYRGLVPPHVR